MRDDYDSERTVRHARWLGWGVCLAITLGLVWAMAVKILQVSEARTISATRENITASLTALAAERVAKGLAPDKSWLQRNPFQLLRWVSSDYCGELQERQLPQAGCWHYLPARSWVLHRSRFSDDRGELAAELQVFQLQAVPMQLLSSAESKDGSPSLELIAVPAAEVSALVDSY